MKAFIIKIKITPVQIDPFKFLRRFEKRVRSYRNYIILKRRLNKLAWTDKDVFDKTIFMAGNLQEAIETLAYELVGGSKILMPTARKLIANKYETGWA